MVADRGPHAADHGERQPRDPPLGRCDPLRASHARGSTRPRCLRGSRGSRQVLSAHPHEQDRHLAEVERLRLQRVDPGSATRGSIASRRDRARRCDGSDPGPQPLQHRATGARRVRPRQRGPSLVDGRQSVVPRPKRLPRAAGGALPRGPLRPLRRGSRSLRGAARVRHPGARRGALPRVLAGPGEVRLRGA
jgi:hypothetical protein